MKENNFYSDDFEQLIRGKTEQYKMYPSENVWKGVHNALHTKRKWFIGSMAFLVTGILFLAGRELIAPSTRPVALHKTATAADSMAEVSKASTAGNSAPAPLVILRSNAVAATGRHDAAPDGEQQQKDEPVYKGISITVSNPVFSQSNLSEWLSQVVRLPEHAPDLSVIEGKIDQAKADEDGAAAQNGSAAHGTDMTRSAAEHREDGTTAHGMGDEADADGNTVRGVLQSLGAGGAAGWANRQGVAGTGTGRYAVKGKDRIPDSTGAATKASAAVIAEAQDMDRINWLRDYAMNILPPTPKSGRTYLQLTLAPTINYRTLGGNDPAATKFAQASSGPYAPIHVGGPNDFVNHSPVVGFEASGSILYRVTRNLSIKGGLQFNFNRYTIRAYASSRPQQATITLNTYYGYYMDSINSTTSNSNLGGKSAETLENDYFQLSAPVGFELRVLGNERLQFNVGATIQPSYLLNTNSYMLTSGYTDYTKEPSLFRRWNVSGGVEAFLSYRMGPIRWQIGPEFRYQLLSSYKSAYPITENLKGYGLKIGITKMLP